MTSRNTPPFSSPKSAYANGPWIQFKGVSFKWAYTHPHWGLWEKVTWEKLGTLVFFFFSQNMIQLACISTGYYHGRGCRVHSIGPFARGGARRGLIQPIVTVCLKCGVQQGGKQDPSKFMPLCEREEKGCGVRSWRNRIIPFTFVKAPLVFCVSQDKFKRRCHNGSIGMISLSTIDVASFHEQLKAPLFLLLGEMFGYMQTLWMRKSCCNTTCYKILSMITHVVVSWMLHSEKGRGICLDCECDFFPPHN